MLRVKEVSKKFKNVLAMDNVSFEVRSGEVIGLLGPNGAGKSTTIKLIAGLLRKTAGTISIKGFENTSIDAKSKFAYIPEFPQIYDMLTIDEHMEFISQAYNIKDSEKFIAPYLELFDLMDKRRTLGKELSKGMKQKLSICCAILTQAELYLFDEPMIGLDPKAIREMKKIMQELAYNGKSLLVSTHLLDSIEHTCNRVLVMKEGKIIINSAMDKLRKIKGVESSLEDIFLEVTSNE